APAAARVAKVCAARLKRLFARDEMARVLGRIGAGRALAARLGPRLERVVAQRDDGGRAEALCVSAQLLDLRGAELPDALGGTVVLRAVFKRGLRFHDSGCSHWRRVSIKRPLPRAPATPASLSCARAPRCRERRPGRPTS